MHNQEIKAALIAAAVCLGACGAGIGKSALPGVESTQTSLQTLVSERVAAADFSGVILVADQNEIIFEEAYNSSSLEDAFSVDTNSQFAIASITKSFTAILVLQLVEKGSLSLDDPLSAYLPSFHASYADHVTLRHLLQNRSGLPHYTEIPGWFDPEFKKTLMPEAMLSAIASMSPRFEPGSDYLYSNANSYLLGLVIEATTGASYDTVLSEQILGPSGLKQTRQIYDDDVVAVLVRNALRGEDGTYTHVPVVNPQVFRATASMSTTARDLFRWHKALQTDILLSSESKAIMFDPIMPMAWTVGTVPLNSGETLSLQTYNGEMIGYTSMITRFPDHRGTVIILNNNDAGYDLLANLTLEIAAELYGP